VPGGFDGLSVSFGLSAAMMIGMTNVVSESALEVRNRGGKVLLYGGLGNEYRSQISVTARSALV
jgi:hypothetical protein